MPQTKITSYYRPVGSSSHIVPQRPAGRGSAPSRNKGAYKKKGAYRKKNKKQFKNARRPFVEGKTRNLADVLKNGLMTASNPPDTMALSTAYPGYGNQTIPLDDAYTAFQVSSFITQAQGLQDYQMIGQSIYVKYIKAKLQIQFPPTHILTKPAQLFLIHGWITTPPMWTDTTTPKAHEVTRAQLNAHINERLKQYFNEKQDQLQFRPKTWNNGIKVLGHQKVVPDIQRQFSIPAEQPSGVGSLMGAIPNVNKSCTWSVQRKVHYQISEEPVTGEDPVEFLYPNTSWLPFMCLYNPDFRHFTADEEGADVGNRIRVLMNNQTWYSDS